MTVQPEVAQLPDQLLRDFVYASDALLCIVDGDGRILLSNPALQRFTARSADELLGGTPWRGPWPPASPIPRRATG
jgi:PAS domain S-box-containing protein